MKQVPKQDQPDVAGGTVYDPSCFPPDDLGYPGMPGCPCPPTFPDPTFPEPCPAPGDPTII